MKTKHTEGKWIVDQDGLHYPTEITNGKYDSRLDAIIGGKQIAIVTKEYDEEEYDNDEVQANAKLIAAAPDLLEACVMALEMYREIQPEGGWQAVEDYCADAIKKATG